MAHSSPLGPRPGRRFPVHLVPDVYLLRGARGCNVYYLADPDNPTLIDAGLPWARGALVRAVRSLPDDLPPPRQTLLTHYHIDHVGGAAHLRDVFGAAVVTHPAECSAFVERLLANGKPTPRHVRWYTRRTRPDRTVGDGDILPILGGLQVIHTPGHTPGSLCFHLTERGVLFTGDQFISYSDRLSRPFMGVEADRAQYRESLAKIASLGARTLLPGHGYPVLYDAQDLLDGMVARRGRSAGKLAWARNVPRLVRFTVGMWRDTDIPRAPLPKGHDSARPEE